jgi:hypothetical protein
MREARARGRSLVSVLGGLLVASPPWKRPELQVHSGVGTSRPSVPSIQNNPGNRTMLVSLQGCGLKRLLGPPKQTRPIPPLTVSAAGWHSWEEQT